MNENLSLNNLSGAAKASTLILGVLANWFGPVWPFLLVLLVLVACDTVVGRWAAKRRGDTLTPEKEGKVVVKLVMYPMAVLLSELMVWGFFKDLPLVDSLTYVVALYICTLEFRSVMRNIGEATGTDVWKVIADWLSSRGAKPEE